MQTFLAQGYDWESTRLAEFIRRILGQAPALLEAVDRDRQIARSRVGRAAR